MNGGDFMNKHYEAVSEIFKGVLKKKQLLP